jgi:hypothetical protein
MAQPLARLIINNFISLRKFILNETLFSCNADPAFFVFMESGYP